MMNKQIDTISEDDLKNMFESSGPLGLGTTFESSGPLGLGTTFENEDDENKWVIIKDGDDYKRHTELIREVENLKSIVIEMHKMMIDQNENISKIGENMELMKSFRGNYRGKYCYIRDYLFPALRIAGAYTPFIVLLSTKTGIASSVIRFLFSRFLNFY
jgi:hypothetical protein